MLRVMLPREQVQCTTCLRFMSDMTSGGTFACEACHEARRSGSPPDWQVNLTAIEHFRQTNPRDTGAEPSGMSRDSSLPGFDPGTEHN